MKILDLLVTEFGTVKEQADDFKKKSESLNKELKKELASHNLDSYTAGGFTVKMSTQQRESMNEDMMLDILSKAQYTDESGAEVSVRELGIIKTKEYIDMDALESALYNEQLSEETLLELAKCKTVKEVTTLRVSKAKEK